MAQPRNYDVPLMTMDVGNFSMSMNKIMGEGQLGNQYSWMLTGTGPEKTEIFYWPADRWQSNMLYQIFNPLVLDTGGIVDSKGVRRTMYVGAGIDALINSGKTDWCREIRRYRPPHIVVDGVQIDSPYQWYVDPSLKSDIKLEWEDVLNQFGIRSHIEMYGFSNPNHADYFIWKTTHTFTGELKVPRDAKVSADTIPDQTIGFWWPCSFSFGPSKAGERQVNGGFSYEGTDDLDSWFKKASEMPPGSRSRDSLAIAYYWDSRGTSTVAYPNGSKDDTGDPDRTTGFLNSTAVCGYTLLHADISAVVKTDDLSQPYAMSHAGIYADLWGRRDIGLLQTYRGDDARGRFPLDPITAGFMTKPDYGPMRFIVTGPYRLTKDHSTGRYDSVTFVYAVGAGSIGMNQADSIGRAWFAGRISDSTKNSWVLKGRDSLGKVLDRANWAWNRLAQGLPIPSAPLPPDIEISSGPGKITVRWSYPNNSSYLDAVTGVDDWYSWRVYRKAKNFLVNDPADQKSGARWDLVYQTTNRNQREFVDTAISPLIYYYYAVTAVDDGTQGLGIADDPQRGEKLESSRFVTRASNPAMTTQVQQAVNRSVPRRLALMQNYPNPFNPSTMLSFDLPASGFVSLRIYDILGREVSVVVNEALKGGSYRILFDASRLASGTYIYRLMSAGKSLARTFVVLK
jgi:hypothetical protein